MNLDQSPASGATPVSSAGAAPPAATRQDAPRFAGLAGLAPGDPMDSARLMSVILSLAGEVYVLKSELQRMRLALAERKLIDDGALETAGQSAAMAAWFATEEAEFGRALLHAFTSPDESPDVSAAMFSR
jgi:hypothetical protein